MELSEIQYRAVNHINKSFAGNINPICALGMGSGKTRVACKVISEIQQNNECYRILIVAKAAFFDDPWEKELEGCGLLAQYSGIVYLYGKEREAYLSEARKYIFAEKTIIMTSYDTLVKDIENNCYDVNDIFNLIVIDEIQLFMNSKKLTKRCKIISRLPALRKLALSGTPIQNSDSELGLAFLFLNNPELIVNNRVEMKDSLKKALDDCRTQNALFYHSEIKKGKFKKHETILCLPADPQMLSFSRSKLGTVKKKLMYLSNPNSVYYRRDEKYKIPFCSKVEAVKAILAKNRLQKFIIFSQFIDVLYAYEDIISEMGMRSIVITGNDKGDKFIEKLNTFEHSKQCNVLLTTLQKSSEGLNLSFANHIIILEMWWNPQKIFQAMNRIDRKDQRTNIYIYLLCYHVDRKFIEEEKGIYEAMSTKNEEANTAFKEYIGDGNNSQLRELPRIDFFENIDSLNKDLSKYLDNIYKYPDLDWMSGYYSEEDKGVPLNQILEEAKEHPLTKNWEHKTLIESLEEAINKSRKTGKKHI